MLTALSIRDIVLVDALDLEVHGGLTVLTGETGAGKSIILDALGLALGARADAGLVRAGAKQASATAVFTAPDDPALIALISERGFDVVPGEELILRRTLAADGRSRAFVNDQPAGVTALREIGQALVEVHGQHETVGLLDWKTHRALLDNYGGLQPQLDGLARAADRLKAAERTVADLKAAAADAASRAEELTQNLADLDDLDPRADEETELAGERAILGAAEKAVADLADARASLGGDKLSQKLSAALRAVEHARTRAGQAGTDPEHPLLQKLAAAAEAIDRTMVEAEEAIACVDAAANAFDFEPGRLDKAEERLFALRAAARKLNTSVESLPVLRLRFREQLRLIEDGAEAISAAERAASAAREAYDVAAILLTSAREAAADRLTAAVMEELAPLKLERARFRVAFEPVTEGRRGPLGVETVRHPLRPAGRHCVRRRTGPLRPGDEGGAGGPRGPAPAGDDLRRGRPGRRRRRGLGRRRAAGAAVEGRPGPGRDPQPPGRRPRPRPLEGPQGRRGRGDDDDGRCAGRRGTARGDRADAVGGGGHG